nr:MAG TPA: KilA protein [Caudoviricetes sp.]
MSVQTFSFGNVAVSFRQDGYLNATAIAAHFGKLPKDYLKTEQTQQYIAALAESLSERTKILTDENQLVIVKKGNSKNFTQGTWLHPKLAIHFARWLDPKFAVWCDMQIEQLLSGSLQPKPTKALPDGLTAEQIETVKKLHNALVKSAPKEQQAKIAITLWSAVKSKFGVSYKEVPAEQFAEVLSVMSRVAVEKGVLYGEVLEKQPAPAAPVLDDALLLSFARLLLHAQDMRLFVNRYLPAFQNLGIDGRGSLWSFVHDTEPTFAAVRRFMTAQSVQSGFFARDWDWVRSRILSTAQAF